MTTARRRLPPAVVLLGLTSLLTDAGSDMITPLLPAFVVGVLGAKALTGGLIEGAADAVSSLLRYPSGRLADRLRRRKPLVVAGYSLSSLTKPLVGLATLPGHVLAVRLLDRLGKGVRSAPRDALIADVAPPGESGRAFGFHRAMDHAGAVIGPLVAAALLALGMPLREVFLWAAVPSVLAVACALAVREQPRSEPLPAAPAEAPRVALPGRLRSLLGIVLLFSLAASSDFFVLLRAQDLGVPLAAIPLLAAALSVVKMTGSALAGRWSDRIGRVPLVLAGWLTYALAYAGLALATSAAASVVLILAYGAYHGLTEPTERALIADLAPAAARGRAYGAYNAIVGLAALPAAALTGLLWDRVSPASALLASAALAIAATLALGAWSARKDATCHR